MSMSVKVATYKDLKKFNYYQGGYFMSQNDEMAARGRLITDYAEVKKHLATLEGEASRIGKILGEISRQLLNQPDRLIFEGQSYTAEYMSLASFERIDVDAQRLPALVDEIRNTKEELRRLREKVAPLGIID